VGIDVEAAGIIDRYAADEITFADMEDQLTAASGANCATDSTVRVVRERIVALIRQESKRQGVMLWQNPYLDPRDSISEVKPSSEPRPRPPRRRKMG
jgi:hypothetical protein